MQTFREGSVDTAVDHGTATMPRLDPWKEKVG